MNVDVIMPKLGESITEGIIVEWMKNVGDQIEKDEILLEIGTDKVDSEIPSPAGGVLVEILAKKNDVVPVNQVIARIETEGTAKIEAKREVVGTVSEKKPAKEALAQSLPKEIAQVPIAKESLKREEKTRYYTPLVRAIARAEGISSEELESLKGTGREARITKTDLLAYIKQRQARPAPTEKIIGEISSTPIAPSLELGEEVVEMDRMRQIIATHMRKSLDTSAHVFVVSECDMTNIVRFVNEKQTEFQKAEGFKLTYTPFFVLAAVKTLSDFPVFNASIEGTNIHYHRNKNIGMAVSVEKGLLVPVIKNCEELNFLGICRKVKDIAEKSRQGKISPEELQGSTFSITNFGVFGNVFGMPIINQPNVGILGVGSITKRPVVKDTETGEAILIRSMCFLSIGFDHRLIDGAGAGQFLKRMVGYLESIDLTKLF